MKEIGKAEDYLPNNDDDYSSLCDKLDIAESVKENIMSQIRAAESAAMAGIFKDDPNWAQKAGKALSRWGRVSKSLKREITAIERMDLSACIVMLVKGRFSKEEWYEIVKQAEKLHNKESSGD